MRKIIVLFFFPILVYSLFCIALTYPLIRSFNTHLYGGTLDGYQNLWNIWWFNKANVELHIDPWFTNFLFYPHGTTLMGHPLNVANALPAVVLMRFLTLGQTYNTLIFMTFIFTGYTMFLLIRYLSQNYWIGLIGGYLFTFSNFHFTHAHQHLELATLYWLPLFFLFLIRWWHNFSIQNSVFLAVTLYLLLLTSYYYFTYAVLSGGFLSLYYCVRVIRKVKPNSIKIIKRSIFLLALIAVTSGQHILKLNQINTTQVLLGSHPEIIYSNDAFAFFIPASRWRFNQLTQIYWSRILANADENGSFLGLGVLFLLSLGLFVFKKPSNLPNLIPWYALLLIFAILSYGPLFTILGQWPYDQAMPYKYATTIFPTLSLGGMPIRFSVMVTFFSVIIATLVLTRLIKHSGKLIILLFPILASIFVLDTLPAPLTTTKLSIPSYINTLRSLQPGGFLDTVHSPAEAMYAQTLHGLPLTNGYVARLPQQVSLLVEAQAKTLENQDYWTLCRIHRVSYILLPSSKSPLFQNQPLQPLFTDGKISIYNLVDSPLCQEK